MLLERTSENSTRFRCGIFTCKFSVRSISFSSAASGPICRRENASVGGAIWLKLNFWLALEEERASKTEAPIVLERDGKSLCTVHALLPYNRRPTRKAVRYMLGYDLGNIQLKRKVQIKWTFVGNSQPDRGGTSTKWMKCATRFSLWVPFDK